MFLAPSLIFFIVLLLSDSIEDSSLLLTTPLAFTVTSCTLSSKELSSDALAKALSTFSDEETSSSLPPNNPPSTVAPVMRGPIYGTLENTFLIPLPKNPLDPALAAALAPKPPIILLNAPDPAVLTA